MSVKPLSLVILGCLALALIDAATSGQCVVSAEEPQQDEKIVLTSRWEETIHRLRGAMLNPDGKRIVCRTNDLLIVLNAEDGNTLWEYPSDRVSTFFGQSPDELFVHSIRESTIRVLAMETGKVVREFECPRDVRIGTHGTVQTKNGYIYCTADNGKQIVRFREGDREYQVIFDGKEAQAALGLAGRVTRPLLLLVDEDRLFFAVRGHFGIRSIETGDVTVPDNNTGLYLGRMFQRVGDNILFYTATSDAIVQVSDKGQLQQFAKRGRETRIHQAFVNPHQRLFVSAENTGEHQPAFIRMHELDTGRTQRILWHSEEIRGIVPDATASMFISFNGGSQLAMWDITTMPATEDDADSPSNNRTNR